MEYGKSLKMDISGGILSQSLSTKGILGSLSSMFTRPLSLRIPTLTKDDSTPVNKKGNHVNSDNVKTDDDFIPSYDGKDLKPIGNVDITSMEINGELDKEESRIFRYLQSDDGKATFAALRGEFKDLLEVKGLLEDKTRRTDDATWDKLDSVLQRFSSTLLAFGRDRYHYGSDLALMAEHTTSYYNKRSKLDKLTDDDWNSILGGVEDLLYGIYHASIGNLETSDYEAESLGIILDKLLRGNETSRIVRSPLMLSDEGLDDNAYSPAEPTAYPLEPLWPLETGPSSSLKNLFPFFKYWKDKADAFVNSEKEVNITMNIAKFFEDINVTMNDKTDTAELEDIVVKTMNRALGIAMSYDK